MLWKIICRRMQPLGRFTWMMAQQRRGAEQCFRILIKRIKLFCFDDLQPLCFEQCEGGRWCIFKLRGLIVNQNGFFFFYGLVFNSLMFIGVDKMEAAGKRWKERWAHPFLQHCIYTGLTWLRDRLKFAVWWQLSWFFNFFSIWYLMAGSSLRHLIRLPQLPH